jgi:glutathione synthase/RimK-type ligase-like ATP-grasp enzyme
MTARVGILTPDPADEAFSTRWREVFDFTAAPLRAAGLTVEARNWADAADLAGFDLVLPLLVWGYVRAFPHWIERIADWERAGVRLRNPPSVLRWNADKIYMGALERHGAPIVPSIYADRLTPAVMADAARAFGTDRLVAKPRVSHSAWRTIRWSPGDGLGEGPDGPAIVQPYLPAIETKGELSLIWLGGAFSHAVRKVPRAGDFRVQPEYDSIVTPCRPDPSEMAAARRVLAAIDEDLLYARVDLVPGLDGAPALIEIELIEPDLHLGDDAAAGPRFAAAVKSCLAEMPPLSSERLVTGP